VRWKSISLMLAAVSACAPVAFSPVAFAQQVSNSVTLQWFESSWKNIERRAPDLFQAGYGALWTPPPGRSVYLPQGGGIGYDPYDRFDLGKARDATLYGTERQYIGAVKGVQKFGANVYVDYVHHHVGSLDMNLNGYTYPQKLLDQNAPYLQDRSDYPGFELSDPNNNVSSPFHRDTYAMLYGANAGQTPGGDVYEYWFRLGENLVTIDLASNRAFVRNPVPGEANNIRQSTANWAVPTTTILANGRVGSDTKLRQANVATEENRRFYTDTNGPSPTVIDNGVSYTVYDFNLSNPTAGDPVAETTRGYMMRYAQWLTQVVGVDGLRIDAARHVPLGVFNSGYNPQALDIRNLIDRATAGASLRSNLDGTQRQTFNFQEVFNYDPNFLKNFVRKTQPAGDTVNPNRDVLDFSMWSAMATNMTGNGTQNNWFNIRSASMNAAIFNTLDPNVANNGANGIGFVYNHDEGVTPPGTGGTITLDNVAHAWILMRPGNAYVYYRSNEFDRSDNNLFFLKQGRGDALGGTFGNIVTKLVDLRNSYGRGDFLERYIDNAFSAPQDQKSAIYVFERQGSALVGLNVGYNPGATQRTVNTSFQPGQWLEEVTGNWQDPSAAVKRYAVVQSNGQATIDIPWNNAGNGNKGYVVYGLPLPRGTMSVLDASGNAISQVLDEMPTAITNGTARVADIDVITTDTFKVRLATNAVTLNGGTLGTFRDVYADGNAARIKIDEGHDVNGNGFADFPSSASSNATKYGFENFTTINSPGFGSATGNGLYEQNVDATDLSEGYHYVTVRAWRAPRPGESEVFQDFRRAIYVDRFAPPAALDSTAQLVYQSDDRTRDIRIKSLDATADNVHVMFDVPVSLSDSQILSMVNAGNRAEQIDRDLFGKVQSNVGSGNHTVISVTYEPTGNYSIHRFAGQYIGTSRGLGMGDINYDGAYAASDVSLFETVLYSNNTTNPQFNAAGDLNGNGVVDTNDLFALPGRYASVLNSAGFNAANAAIVRRGDFNGVDGTNGVDLDALIDGFNSTSWSFDLTSDGIVGQADVDRMVRSILKTEYGDLNLDFKVDVADLNILAANFGQSNRTWSSADMNGDNFVDLFDFFYLSRFWGYGVPTGSLLATSVDLGGQTFVLTVPEPMLLAVMPGLLLVRRRRL
jgi:alpha-amylase